MNKFESEKKKLETELKPLDKELQELHLQLKGLGEEKDIKKEIAGPIRADLKRLNHTDKMGVSDHALLRYIERMLGIDVEKIRGEIITDELKYQVYKLGNGKYPVNNKFFAIIRDNTVVTVYPINE